MNTGNLPSCVNAAHLLPPLDTELHPVLRALIELSAQKVITQYLQSPNPANKHKARQLGDIVEWARGLS